MTERKEIVKINSIFKTLNKNLSSKVLLLIRFRIQIIFGFNDFVDLDPDLSKMLDPDNPVLKHT
jgi:hypothetical protein